MEIFIGQLIQVSKKNPEFTTEDVFADLNNSDRSMRNFPLLNVSIFKSLSGF